jgi:hypothetical protein
MFFRNLRSADSRDEGFLDAISVPFSELAVCDAWFLDLALSAL